VPSWAREAAESKGLAFSALGLSLAGFILSADSPNPQILAETQNNRYISVMSKIEILQELPKLALEERREIFERICELEENDLLRGGEPTPEEKVLLERELDDYRQSPTAGAPWHEVQARIRKSPKA
jgi:hypothetical protein